MVTKNVYDVYKRTANTSYSCEAGYTLSGSICTKVETTTPTIVSSYYCKDGSTPVNGQCTVTTYSNSNAVTSTPKCTYGTYDSTTGYCIYEGKKEYVCPEYATTGKVSGNKCIVEKFNGYVCEKGTLTSGQTCKVSEKVYGEEDIYDYVTYYRYRTRTYISETVVPAWSYSDNDKDLLSKGYVLTGKKEEVK